MALDVRFTADRVHGTGEIRITISIMTEYGLNLMKRILSIPHLNRIAEEVRDEGHLDLGDVIQELGMRMTTLPSPAPTRDMLSEGKRILEDPNVPEEVKVRVKGVLALLELMHALNHPGGTKEMKEVNPAKHA